MLPQIEENESINLLGVSFGGIMAQELAKVISCKKLIIVSSVKSKREYNSLLKLAWFIRIDKIIPGNLLKWFGKIMSPYFFGLRVKEEKEMLRSIMDDTDIHFLRWAIEKIMNWKGNYQQEIYHIHGSADRIFSVRRIGDYEPIREGGHLMIYNRADEINRLIESEIKKGG